MSECRAIATLSDTNKSRLNFPGPALNSVYVFNAVVKYTERNHKAKAKNRSSVQRVTILCRAFILPCFLFLAKRELGWQTGLHNPFPTAVLASLQRLISCLRNTFAKAFASGISTLHKSDGSISSHLGLYQFCIDFPVGMLWRVHRQRLCLPNLWDAS